MRKIRSRSQPTRTLIANVQPRPGYSITEVIQQLEHHGAKVHRLTNSLLSVEMTEAAASQVGEIAEVREKPLHHLA